MADFFTHFSCVLDVGTPDDAARALKLYQAFMRGRSPREEVPADGFLVSIEPEHGATQTLDTRRRQRRSPAGDPLRASAAPRHFGPYRPLGLPMGRTPARGRASCLRPAVAHVLDLETARERSPGPTPTAGWRAPSQLRAPSDVAAEHPVRARAGGGVREERPAGTGLSRSRSERAPGGSARSRSPEVSSMTNPSAPRPPRAAPLPSRRRRSRRRRRRQAARLLLPDLERGRRIDAAILRAAMEAAFGASDADRRLGLEDRL